MYNNHQKREAFILNNFKRAWSAISGDRNAQIQDVYGNPKTWQRESGPKRVQIMVPDGEGKGMRYYSVLVPEDNYLIDG